MTRFQTTAPFFVALILFLCTTFAQAAQETIQVTHSSLSEFLEKNPGFNRFWVSDIDPDSKASLYTHKIDGELPPYNILTIQAPQRCGSKGCPIFSRIGLDPDSTWIRLDWDHPLAPYFFWADEYLIYIILLLLLLYASYYHFVVFKKYCP